MGEVVVASSHSRPRAPSSSTGRKLRFTFVKVASHELQKSARKAGVAFFLAELPKNANRARSSGPRRLREQAAGPYA